MGTAAQFLPLILLIVLMYFLLIRPQKKREKQTAEMRNSVRVGDEVVTIGGICGKIVKTKDDTLVIEVGADKIKFEIMRWAISKVENRAEGGRRPLEEDDDKEGFAQKKVMPKRMKKTAEIKPEAPANPEVEEVTAEIVDTPIDSPLEDDEK
jgi:preprotein translocase subunit YajC